MLSERAPSFLQRYSAVLWQSIGEFLTGFVLPLKQGIVLFWAVWLSVAFFANTFDGLKALKVMGEGWRFVSGNYASMVETTR